MQLEPWESFAAWAAEVGICYERITREEQACESHLRFDAASAQDRYWLTPVEDRPLLRFIVALLDAQGPWEFCWVLKRAGDWSDLEEGEGLDTLLQWQGIPADFDGALRYTWEERAALAFLIQTQIAFGWCGYYDLWIVPSHGRGMILTDDDDITAVFCPDPQAMQAVIQHLHEVGFELPSAPPGSGFYWQPWMGPKPPGRDR